MFGLKRLIKHTDDNQKKFYQWDIAESIMIYLFAVLIPTVSQLSILVFVLIRKKTTPQSTTTSNLDSKEDEGNIN